MKQEKVLRHLALALVAGIAFNVRAQNLIVNGSFESPGLPNAGDLVSIANGSRAVTGWVSVDNVASGGTADNFYCRTPYSDIWTAPDGQHFIYIDNNGSASPTRNGIYQDVPTVPGQAYGVSFYAATERGGTHGVLGVSAAGTTVRFTLPNSGLPSRSQPPFPGWFAYSFDFTANAATTRLQFFDDGSQPPGDTAGNGSPLLDHVSLNPITSPPRGAELSFAGIYRGRTMDLRSEFIMSVANGSSAAIHVLDYTDHTLDWAEFSTFADGAFSTTTSRGTRVWGRFSHSAVTAWYGTKWFQLMRLLYLGNTQSLAGRYTGYFYDEVAKAVANVTMIATNQGEAFLLVARDNARDAGFGTLDATGNFTVPTVLGDRYSGLLVVRNGTVSGELATLQSGAVPFRLVQQRTGVFQNISTRGYVGSGDNALVVGFVVADFSKDVILRAMGPTLEKFGVTGFLADPMIEVFDSGGRLLGTNDNWYRAFGVHPIPYGSPLADIDAKDAGMTLTLDPGAYTAVVRGVGGVTGVAILEVYEVR